MKSILDEELRVFVQDGVNPGAFPYEIARRCELAELAPALQWDNFAAVLAHEAHADGVNAQGNPADAGLAEDRIANKAIVPAGVYCRQRRAAAALWVQRALKQIVGNLLPFGS